MLAGVAEPLVAVHGQSDQHRLLRPAAQRDALDRFGGDADRPRCWPRYADLHDRLLADRGRARRGGRARARERAREADLLRFGLDEIEAVDAAAGRGRRRWPPRRPGSGSPTPCGRPPSRRARRCPASRAQPGRAGRRPPPPGPLLEGVREHDPEAGELADRLAELTYLLSDLAADVASYASGLETDPARLAAVSERRAALTALTRKYGDTVDEVLAWSEQSAARLLDLDDTDERIERLRAERDPAARRARRDGRRAVRRPRVEAAATARPPRSPPS